MNDCSVGLRLSSSFFAQQNQPETETSTLRSTIGYNAARFRDYYSGHMFLNLAKQLRAWAGNIDSDPTYQDANGYYVQIPPNNTRIQSVWAWGNLSDDVLRRYVMTYTGQGTVNLGNRAHIVQREALSNGERIVFDLTEKGNIQFFINDIPDPTNYPRDFVILVDDPDWVLAYEADQIFTAAYLDHLRPNGLPLAELRHLNTMLVNNSKVVDWSDYPGVDAAVYTSGIPIAILCRLAKQTGHVPWFCIPHLASDDFVTQMATLVAYELPDLLSEIKVEWSNETWNFQFDQAKYCVYKAAEQWGRVLGDVTLTGGQRDVILEDVSGLSVNDMIAFFEPISRTYIQAKINALSGMTVTLDRSHNLPTSTVRAVTSTDYIHDQYHVKRSGEVMALWEAAAGVRPMRVLATHTVDGSGATAKRLNPETWRNSQDASFVEPAIRHDALAVTTYFYAYRVQDAQPLRAAFDVSTQAGRDLALDRILNTPGTGLDELEARLQTQSTLARNYGLSLIIYEGLSDHTITGLSNSEEDALLWQNYADLVYSTAFNPVWDRHFALVRRYIDGPTVQYSDVVTPNQYGLWGLFSHLGESNPRATHVLANAAALTRWWGDDVAPQATDLRRSMIARTTFERTSIDLRIWFTKNAATFSAVNLPEGITLSSKGILTFAPTTQVDVQTQSMITVATATGTSATFDLIFDLTYEAPPEIPAPSYMTLFDDSADLGVELRSGATIAGGYLICDTPGQSPHARLTSFQTLAQATDPDRMTIAFTYRMRSDAVFSQSSTPVMVGPVQIQRTSIRIRTEDGQANMITSQSPICIQDDIDHHIVLVTDFVTHSCTLWSDGVQIATFEGADLTPGASLTRITNASTALFRLGAPFNGTVPVQFGSFHAWLDTAFTPQQVAYQSF